MMISMIIRLTKVVRYKIKGSPAFKKLKDSHLGLALLAVALFALAYTVETKAIVSLLSSQDLFEVAPKQLFYR